MYVLDFFPYPSGEGLSVGHARNYVPTDVLARYFRMRGYAVLHPMGWDAFGLPAENEALMRGRHPGQTTAAYAANYRRQLMLLGCSYDWSREITTSDPAFYKWTQWGFLLLLQRGLAYRATGWQWWCPRCGTILANEQVEHGRCWRHADTPVERRALEQWYVRTTAYADRLLADLDALDWPERIKVMQRNWIGRSEGVQIRFPTSAPSAISVFTARPETLPGAVFIALAPEHPLVEALTTPAQRAEVGRYVEAARRRPEVERMTAQGALSGVFTGAHAAHPLTGAALPVYVAEYVLGHVGTGAVMGVPGADERDAAFARRFGLPVGPAALPGATSGVILADLQRRGLGEAAVAYRMRDWLISRQRYWGAPIPVVYCAQCGTVPVPASELPVRLPDVERYDPAGTGRSPLAGMPEFVRTRCPRCGGPAERETDTLDGFADSNWYFLRFADPHEDRGPWNEQAVRYWLPVDWYVGGAEHAVMHLLYARFFTKVLFDAGLVAFEEPFVRLRNQGSMLSPVDGARMSKSRGNIVTPDEVVARHGADALRAAVLFIGPFDQDVTWDPDAVTGTSRLVRRLRALALRAAAPGVDQPPPPDGEGLRSRLQATVNAAGALIEGLRFNVLIAELMSLLNYLERAEPAWRGTAFWRDAVLTVTKIAAPVMPFVAEEMWTLLGQEGSVHQASWPAAHPPGASAVEATIVVQVDGRLRDRMSVRGAPNREELIAAARARDRVRRALDGRTLANVVVVPGQVVNFVTKQPGTREAGNTGTRN